MNLKLKLLLFSLCVSTVPLSQTMYLPSLVSIRKDLKTTEYKVSLTLSVYQYASAISALIYGPIVDYVGRRYNLLTCLLLLFIGSLSCSLSNNITMLILCRIFSGCASGIMITITACISDIIDKSYMARAMALNGIGIQLSLITGPVLGGFISKNLGWRYIF